MGCHIINHVYHALKTRKTRIGTNWEEGERRATTSAGLWEPASAGTFPAREGMIPGQTLLVRRLAKGKPFNNETVNGLVKLCDARRVELAADPRRGGKEI
jgi:hypothetical protein